MNWYPGLYVGETVRNKKKKIIWKLNHHKVTIGIYLITLAANPEDMLDIIHANLLLQPLLRKQPLYIVGVACGYIEALDVVTNIANDVYKERKDISIREYLLDKWNY